jgi:dTDP-4-dehydrorhamnose 3,5-epimerase
MNVIKTFIDGVFIVERKTMSDDRGFFSRIMDVKILKEAGMNADFVQGNLSLCYKKGVLRGMHTQLDEAAEDKLVNCIRGAVFDVCVDVRPGSATFGKWVGEVLSDENNRALYVPKGFAHGYLSLTDDSLVMYYVTQFYTPGAERGYRHDDPAFGIKWPLDPPYIVSDKDMAWPLIGEA